MSNALQKRWRAGCGAWWRFRGCGFIQGVKKGCWSSLSSILVSASSAVRWRGSKTKSWLVHTKAAHSTSESYACAVRKSWPAAWPASASARTFLSCSDFFFCGYRQSRATLKCSITICRGLLLASSHFDLHHVSRVSPYGSWIAQHCLDQHDLRTRAKHSTNVSATRTFAPAQI